MAKKIDLTDSHINGETATVPVSPEMNFDTNIYSILLFHHYEPIQYSNLENTHLLHHK